ncbi:hypothetical protein [Lactobacillus gallinarum]|uniref:hypothetical protein n=1 Tax=Lactobacillus gallinarum TaxID=52242 RepID=UPI0024B25DB0|nr:hypothetical protein [Lactobacillus gallinarum]
MADGYKNKLRSSVLTNAGRQTFLQVGNGVGTLVYTRAILTSQTMNDSNGNPLDNEIIASFSNLSDDLKDGKLQLTPVTGNHFEVIANFDNKNQAQDIVFRAIGWYARIDTKNSAGQIVKGPEQLIAVSPTTNESEVLAAGSPDGLSTQVISAALDMTISNAANISMTVNDISYVTRAELDAWQTKIEETISAGYIELPMRNSQGQQLFDHDGKAILFKKPLIESDKTLSQQGKPADASAIGQRLDNIDHSLEQLNQNLYQNFDTKQNAQDLENGIIANADANKDQDNKIAELQNRASELEANTQTIHLLGHDWNGLSDHANDSFKATSQFIVNDATLTRANAYANAKATGDAIKQNYQQLSQAIGIIYAWLDNLGNQQVIIDIKNRLSVLEDQKKENK